MFKKLFEKWKHEWWEKKSSYLEKEHNQRLLELTIKFESELEAMNVSGESQKQALINRINIEEDELKYRLQVLEDRKFEVIKADNDLKTQIKLLEAKASPTAVWVEAFTSGVNKTWDMLLPVMTGNIETMRKKIYEDAINDSLKRMGRK